MSKNLFKSTIRIILVSFISKTFGLLRDIAIASAFGSSHAADIINVAMRFTNAFRRILSEGALLSAFVPAFTKYSSISKEEGMQFANNIFWILFVSSISVVILMECNVLGCLYLIAPGFLHNEYKRDLACSLCKVSNPYLIFIVSYNLIGGVLQSNNKFLGVASGPIIFSISVISAILLNSYFGFNEKTSGILVMYAILISGLLQVLYLLLHLKYYKLGFINFNFSFHWPRIKSFFTNFFPAFINAGSLQIQIFISTAIISSMDGAIAIISYAERIYSMPISILGVNIATIILPSLSKNKAIDNKAYIYDMQKLSVKVMLFFSFPISLVMFVLSYVITHMVYERGCFFPDVTLAVSNCIRIFSLTLTPLFCLKVLNNIFYIHYKNKDLAIMSFVFLALNVLLNLIFICYYKIGYIALPISACITSWLQLVCAVIYLKQKQYFAFDKELLLLSIKFLLASVITACTIFFIKDLFFDFNYSYYKKILLTSVILFISLVIYLISCLSFRVIKIKAFKIIF
jgi:putative peptidoglycan lipid II flippase